MDMNTWYHQMPTLFCSKCGLEALLDDVGLLSPCVACGNAVFAPARWIGWSAALTEPDKRFLRSLHIAIT